MAANKMFELFQAYVRKNTEGHDGGCMCTTCVTQLQLFSDYSGGVIDGDENEIASWGNVFAGIKRLEELVKQEVEK